MKRFSILPILYLFVLVTLCLIYPFFTNAEFTELSSNIFLPPSRDYWFGTDSLGRDLFGRVVFGARVSLLVGAISALCSVSFGVFYGAMAAWLGGKTEWLMMKIIDLLFSIPTLVFLILISVFFNSLDWQGSLWLQSILTMTLSLVFVSWMGVARIIRGLVLKIRSELYIESARAIGASEVRQVLKHVLPNTLGTVLVLLTFQIPYNILFESFLSFIGLGLQPPYSSWGVLINDGWKNLQSYPHIMIFPGLTLFFTSLSFNHLGDQLRDYFDPKFD